jgi:hypothetical protein
VATKEEYERVLLKAEISGLSSLRKDEVELLKRLVKEMSPLVSRVVSDFTVSVRDNGVCLLLRRSCCVPVMSRS